MWDAAVDAKLPLARLTLAFSVHAYYALVAALGFLCPLAASAVTATHYNYGGAHVETGKRLKRYGMDPTRSQSRARTSLIAERSLGPFSPTAREQLHATRARQRRHRPPNDQEKRPLVSMRVWSPRHGSSSLETTPMIRPLPGADLDMRARGRLGPTEDPDADTPRHSALLTVRLFSYCLRCCVKILLSRRLMRCSRIRQHLGPTDTLCPREPRRLPFSTPARSPSFRPGSRRHLLSLTPSNARRRTRRRILAICAYRVLCSRRLRPSGNAHGRATHFRVVLYEEDARKSRCAVELHRLRLTQRTLPVLGEKSRTKSKKAPGGATG